MSQALRDVIPVMNLLQEMREQNFKVVCIEPYVYCKVFEDNAGALELRRLPKLHPRTKRINICYHHFCNHVQKGLIKIFPIDTKDQIADALTKALAQHEFPASSPPYVQCITSLSHQSEGVLCNWEYFGTNFGYLPNFGYVPNFGKLPNFGLLPTIPTSPQCDTFQLIPVSF